jgi:YegS/Rv2252/BmrU family lipid kinase
MSQKVTLIYNPTAGTLRREPAIIERLTAALHRRGLFVTPAPTTCAEHASELARQAVEDGTDYVLVCGGDGTINEAVQGLIGSHTALALYPGGTANVFAKELGLAKDPDAIAELIAKGQTRTISVGRAWKTEGNWQRYFLLMAGIGLDAAIVQSVNLEWKKKAGIGAYVAAGLGFLARLPLTPFTFSTSFPNDDDKRASTFTLIANAANYAACFSIAPDAQLEDKDFKVCSFNSHSRLAYLAYALLSVAGRHTHSPGVIYERATQVSANSNDAALVQLDGEVVGHLPMQFEKLPGALRVVAPPQP